MFNVRMALKMRLEELDKREERVAKECRDEREQIYERLRKLDEQETFFTSDFTENSGTTIESEQEEKKEAEHTSVVVEEASYDEVMNETILPLVNEMKELLEIERTEKEEFKRSLENSQAIIKEYKELAKREKGKSNRNGTRNSGTRRGKRNAINYAPLYEATVSILKQHTASVPASTLKKDIEARTDFKIENMTAFMQRLMKDDVNIEKPYRGEYFYRRPDTDISLSYQESAVTEEGSKLENQVDTNDNKPTE